MTKTVCDEYPEGEGTSCGGPASGSVEHCGRCGSLLTPWTPDSLSQRRYCYLCVGFVYLWNEVFG